MSTTTPAPEILTEDSVLFDSATAKTMFNHLKWFTNLAPLAYPMVYTSSTNSDGYSYHVGTVEITTKNDQGQPTRVTIDGAYYAPIMPLNLVSGKALAHQNKYWDHYNNRLWSPSDPDFKIPMVYKGDVPVILADVPNDFDQTVITPQMAVMASVNYHTMHKRLLHAGKTAVLKACQEAGIELKGKHDDYFCEPCVLSKKTDELLPQVARPACSRPLEFIRLDLVVHGQRGHLNYLYTLHFVDVYCGFHWVKFAAEKSDCLDLIKQWLAMVERQTNLKVKMIGLDGGTEFGQSSTEFQKGKLTTWTDELGVEVWRTPKHTPWMNGKSERAGREIMAKARTLMIANAIPEHLWPFVVESVVKVLNLLPTRANPDMKSPHEAFAEGVGIPQSSVKPYIRHLRTYFCDAYYYLKKQDRVDSDKWAPRSKRGKLIGYGDLHGRIYYIWNPDEGKIVRASAVQFNEGDKPPPEEEEIPLKVYFADSTYEEVLGTTKSPISIPISIGGASQQQGAESAPPQQKPAEKQGILKKTVASDQDGRTTPRRVDFYLTPEPETPTQDQQVATTARSDDQPEDHNEMDTFYDFDEELNDENPIPMGRETFVDPLLAATQAPGEVPDPGGPSQVQGEPRPTRQRHGPGYYKDLATGKIRPEHLSAVAISKLGYMYQPIAIKELCLSAVKVTHDLETNGTTVPKNYQQAQRLPNFKTYWLPAMEAQLRSLQERGVFVLVERKRGMRVLPGKWVFDEKMEPSTGITSARARYVICGNFETASWNMEDLYAAVANATSFRLFMAICAWKGYHIEQFDFKTAFLNSHLKDDHVYYVEQPRGLSKGDNLVWHLKKAMYGLRRAPQYWFETILPVLQEMGFEPLSQDTCLFKNEKTGVLLLLYVDDVLMGAATLADIHVARDQLNNKFDLKEIGEVKRYLGFDIVRNLQNNTVFISQEAYTKMVLSKFSTLEGGGRTTCPWPSKVEIPRQWDPLVTEARHYIKQTGSLLYLSTGTRPDITYTISRLCEGNAGPGQEHLTVLKHLYRYLTTTKSMGLLLGGKYNPHDLGPIAYADASYADDLATRHSTGGHVVFFAGGPVFWKTKKQTFVALSTTEAEFCNLTPAAKSVQWVAEIVKELGIAVKAPIVVFTDSANARIHVLNPQKAARTRCIDIRYKWIVEQTRNGLFEIKYVKGEEMIADGLTKPLLREKHEKFVKLLGMASIAVPWLN